MKQRTYLGLIIALFATSTFAQSNQTELIQNLSTPPKYTRNLFEKSSEYRSWADKAAGSLKALAAESDLSKETFQALTSLIQIENSQLDRAEGISTLRLQLLWDNQWISPIGPISTVLAKHQSNHEDVDAVAYLIERYQKTRFGNGNDKIEIFFALIPFQDDRSAYVFADQISFQRDSILGRKESPDWTTLARDVAPVLFRAAQAGDERAQVALNELTKRNPEPAIQNAAKGIFIEQDPKKFRFAQVGANGRPQFVETPFDAKLQENTEAGFAKQSEQIGSLNTAQENLTNQQDALAKTVEQNKAQLDQELASLKKTNEDMAAQINNLDYEQKRGLQEANARINAAIVELQEYAQTASKEAVAQAREELAQQIRDVKSELTTLADDVRESKSLISVAATQPSTQPTKPVNQGTQP